MNQDIFTKYFKILIAWFDIIISKEVERDAFIKIGILLQRYEIVNGVVEVEGVDSKPAADLGADEAAEGT